MQTFPLRYNFLPLSMGITSWIVKKKLPYAEKVVCKKVKLQVTFLVRLVRSLINLWFSTNQVEETNKQIKLRWREVDRSLMAMLPVWEIVQNCLLRLYVLYQKQQQQINQQPKQYYINQNQNCDDEDFDETNLKPHLYFSLLLHTLFSAINQDK